MKRLGSILMAAITVLNMSVPSLAVSSDENKSEAVLNQAAANFNVTVPGQLPVDIDEFNNVTVATDVKLLNNSSGPIRVVSVGIEPINGWNLKESTVTEQVDKKEFTLNVTTEEQLIPAKSSTLIVYSSDVSPQRAYINEVMAHVNFLVDWYQEDGTSAKLELLADKTKLQVSETANLTVVQEEASAITWENSNPFIVELVDSMSRSGVNKKVARAMNIGTSTITITDELGNKASKDIIVVENALVAIEIVQNPTKTAYDIGDTFDPTGMKVEAIYELGQRYELDLFRYDTTPIVAGQTKVEISYTERGKKVTTDCAITVNAGPVVLTGIEIDTEPTKTNYKVGDNFDKTGMVVNAVYSDGSKTAITDYTVTNGTSLTADQTSVTISYNGKTVNQAITVVEPVLDRIEITKLPTKVVYVVGDIFNPAGMIVTAVYDNGTQKAITDYTYSKNALIMGTTSVEIEYKGKTANVAITVNNFTPPVLGEKYREGNYEYSYGQGWDGAAWANITGQNGWGVRVIDATQTTYLSPLTVIKGQPVTNLRVLFYKNNQEELHLVDWDTSNIENITSLFNNCSAKKITGLENFNTSKVTAAAAAFSTIPWEGPIDLSQWDTTLMSTSNMFLNSKATLGYAKTQADADRLNASANKPATLIFIVKGQEPISLTVKTPPTKVNYTDTEKLNLAGLSLEAEYRDGTKETVTTGYITTPKTTDVLSASIKEIKISYKGVECTTPITVKGKELSYANGDVIKSGTIVLDGDILGIPLKPDRYGDIPTSGTGDFNVINTVSGKDPIQWVYVYHNGKDMLISDRVLLRGISYNTLKAKGLADGKTVEFDGKKYIMRSIDGGWSQVPTAPPSDKNNEWSQIIELDTYKIGNSDSKWHWNNMYTICQNVIWVSSASKEYVINRGLASAAQSHYALLDAGGDYYGFRPVLEYIEDVDYLSISGMPKVNYATGDALDLSNLEVSFNTADGNSEVVTGYTVSIADGTILKTTDKIVEVEYNGNKAYFGLNVQDKNVVNMVVNTSPVKTTYKELEKLDFSDLKVDVEYNNEIKETLGVADLKLVPANGATLSLLNKEITVTYMNKNITIPITVEYSDTWDSNPMTKEEATAAGWRYVENGSEITLSSYVGTVLDNVKTPSSIDGKRVTTLGLSTATNVTPISKTMRSLEMADSITTVETCAFYSTPLTSVKFSNSLNKIKSNAFINSSLASLDFPDTLEIIESGAFQVSKELTSVEIPSSVNTLGYRAFEASPKLTSVKLNGKIDNLQNSTFKNCKVVNSIDLGQNNPSNNMFDGCIALTTVELAEGITEIGSSAFSNAGLTNVKLPSTLNKIGSTAFTNAKFTSIQLNEGLQEIGGSAFIGAQLTSINLPQSLKTIGGYAFQNTKITSIIIPKNVEVIGPNTFYGNNLLHTITFETGNVDPACLQNTTGVKNIIIAGDIDEVPSGIATYAPNLETFKITGNVKSIGANALKDKKKLHTVVLNDGIESIKTGALSGCTLLSVINIPNSLSSIGDNAFYNCSSLSAMELKDTDVAEIGKYAFYGCTKLQTLTLPNSLRKIDLSGFNGAPVTNVDLKNTNLESIGTFAFAGNKLINVELPDTLKTIGDSAFLATVVSNIPYPTITTLSLPEGLESIGANAFKNQSKITSVKFPSTLKSIGISAFSGHGLSEIELPSGLEIVGQGAFASKVKPFKAKLDYNTITGQIFYEQYITTNVTEITFGQNVRDIGEATFAHLTTLPKIIFEEGTTKIGKQAFYGNTAVTSIVLPNSLLEIGDQAFASNSKLASVTFGSGLKSIGNNAFSSDTLLTNIVLPNSIETIGSGAFYSTGITSIRIPDLIQNIPVQSFGGCSKLTSIDFNKIESIGNNAFINCTSLKSVELPSTVKSIGNRAFEGAPLTTLKLNEGLESIGTTAFYSINVPTLEIPSTVKTIANNALSVLVTTINVKAPNGSIANAPWGATKAVINWEA